MQGCKFDTSAFNRKCYGNNILQYVSTVFLIFNYRVKFIRPGNSKKLTFFCLQDLIWAGILICQSAQR